MRLFKLLCSSNFFPFFFHRFVPLPIIMMMQRNITTRHPNDAFTMSFSCHPVAASFPISLSISSCSFHDFFYSNEKNSSLAASSLLIFHLLTFYLDFCVLKFQNSCRSKEKFSVLLFFFRSYSVALLFCFVMSSRLRVIPLIFFCCSLSPQVAFEIPPFLAWQPVARDWIGWGYCPLRWLCVCRQRRLMRRAPEAPTFFLPVPMWLLTRSTSAYLHFPFRNLIFTFFFFFSQEKQSATCQQIQDLRPGEKR